MVFIFTFFYMLQTFIHLSISIVSFNPNTESGGCTMIDLIFLFLFIYVFLSNVYPQFLYNLIQEIFEVEGMTM